MLKHRDFQRDLLRSQQTRKRPQRKTPKRSRTESPGKRGSHFCTLGLASEQRPNALIGFPRSSSRVTGAEANPKEFPSRGFELLDLPVSAETEWWKTQPLVRPGLVEKN